MPYPNKYGGKCAKCGVWVEANQGTYENRQCYCAAHASGPVVKPPQGDPNAVLVTIEKTGPSLDCDEISFKPAGYLGDRFDAFRNACRGAQYGGKSNYTTPNPKLAVTVVENLRKAGFALQADDAAKRFLDDSHEKQKEDLRTADERIARVDATIRRAGKSGLYGFQKEGIRWMVSRPSVALLDDTGCGKSVQTLASLPDKARAVVVAPASVKGVWQKETARWRPDLRTTVLSGRNSFRWPEPGEIVITNYEILPKAVEKKESETSRFKVLLPPEELLASMPSDVQLIADEAHALKEPDAARTKNFRGLSTAIRKACGKVYVLSGTPMKNRPPELWSVLQAAGLAMEAFGSHEEFVRVFHGRMGEYGMEWGKGPPEPEAAEYLKKVSLRRMKVDVIADMPAKTYDVEEVQVDKKTAKLCDEALTAAQKKYGGIEQAIDKLKAMAGGGLAFHEMAAARAALVKAKIPRLLEIVEEYEGNDTPLVVFSAHRDPIDLLGQRAGWAVISGDTPVPRRNQIVDDFQAGKLHGVALTIGAGGTGITLTHAFTMIMVDRMWSPADNLQAEDRIWRIGQKNAVRIIDLIADHPLDQKVHDTLTGKNTLIDASVGATSVVHKEEDIIAKIDWVKVEEEALASAKDYEKAKARILAAASEEEKERERKRAEAARRRVRERVSAAAARRLEEPTEPLDAPRRPAQTAAELWAANGILALTENDPDRAKEKNGIGWNATDGGLGRSLAMMLAWEGLTEQEWRLAVAVCGKYQGQIGARPTREESEEEIRKGIEVALGQHCEKAEKRARRAGTRAGKKAERAEAKEGVRTAETDVDVAREEARAAEVALQAKVDEVEKAQATIGRMVSEVDPEGKISPKKHLQILAETDPKLVVTALEGAEEAARLAAEAAHAERQKIEAEERLAQANAAITDLDAQEADVLQANVEQKAFEKTPRALLKKILVDAGVETDLDAIHVEEAILRDGLRRLTARSKGLRKDLPQGVMGNFARALAGRFEIDEVRKISSVGELVLTLASLHPENEPPPPPPSATSPAFRIRNAILNLGRDVASGMCFPASHVKTVAKPVMALLTKAADAVEIGDAAGALRLLADAEDHARKGPELGSQSQPASRRIAALRQDTLDLMAAQGAIPLGPGAEEVRPSPQEKRRSTTQAKKRVEAMPSLSPGQIYAYHGGVLLPERVVKDFGDFAITES